MTKIAKGRQGDLFEEARGGVLRNEFKDTMARISAANRWAVYKIVQQTIGPLREAYGPASTHRRETLLEECRKSGTEMWNSGDWPSALGRCISCLNIESEYLPGKDAAYVKRETDKSLNKRRSILSRSPTPENRTATARSSVCLEEARRISGVENAAGKAQTCRVGGRRHWLGRPTIIQYRDFQCARRRFIIAASAE